MYLTNLDDRKIEILHRIVELTYSEGDASNMWLGSDKAYMILSDEFDNITEDEIEFLFQYLPDFGFGKLDEYGFRTNYRTVLKEFIDNGGVSGFVEKIKAQEKVENEKSELEINNLRLQVEQLKHESERRKSQIEIDALTIKNLKRNNKVLAFFFAVTFIGWIVDFLSENVQWGWSVFQEQSIQKETPIDKNENQTLSLDSLQSNQLNNSQTNDTIE